MIIVIGSGPTGVAAAMALVQKGQEVLMLDAGYDLESKRQEILQSLRTTPHQKWDPRSILKIRENTRADVSGIPGKRVYGSDYHFRDVEKVTLSKKEPLGYYSSLAKGGQSNVWGAAILPYTKEDLQGWPLSLSDLEPAYKKVLEFLPQRARRDDLEAFFPLYANPEKPLQLSRQAAAFIDDCEKGKSTLNSNGFYCGPSRLAVYDGLPHATQGCVYCGLCLYGCPYSLIYSSRDTLGVLQKIPKFHYRHQFIVEKFKEEGGQVKIQGRSPSNTKLEEVVGEKVLVAAGALSTTRLVLNSLEKGDHEVVLKTSQHFYVPLLRYKAVAHTRDEHVHTLAQIFLEVFEQDPTKNMHLQIYGYNDLMEEPLKQKLGFLAPLLSPLLLGRLLLIQGYLHSDRSSRIRLRLDSDTHRLKVQAEPNKLTQECVASVHEKLKRLHSILRAVPLRFVSSVSPAGSGGHMGGTFPMRKVPVGLETDVMGKLVGFNGVHLVDSSIFPTVPPSTITLTSMANAYRIASQI